MYSLKRQRPKAWRKVVVYSLLGATILLGVVLGYGLSTLPTGNYGMLAIFTITIVVAMQLSYVAGLLIWMK